MINSFLQRKNDIFHKMDKSFKGSWDEKIKKLCNKINSLDNYYTTSSCSGRIVILIDSEKKAKNLFIKVWHDKINFKELKGVLNKILRSQVREIGKSVNNKNFYDNKTSVKNLAKPVLSNKSINFKQEPCILHVACKDINSANKLLKKARDVGLKRSGIISHNSKIICELISTEKLEFPLMSKGKILVNDDFLKIVLKKANDNLKKSWNKIEKLRELIR